MKFRFIGDPNEGGGGPLSIQVFGHTFNRVEGTEVPDTVAAKLRRHSHFEEVTDEAGKGAKAEKPGKGAKAEA